MDSTTNTECLQLEHAIGSNRALAQLTGSRAYERFTGPQIAKIAHDQPAAFENTEKISLISSYIPSLLLGAYASIDYADGSGMNMLDIHGKKWIQKALHACSVPSEGMLGDCVPSHSILGPISPYFQARYGFSSACQIVAWSGDNPNSVAGLGLHDPGDVGVSLGTSDTVCI